MQGLIQKNVKDQDEETVPGRDVTQKNEDIKLSIPKVFTPPRADITTVSFLLTQQLIHT